MDEIVVGAPDPLCAVSLAERLGSVRATVEPGDGPECAVRVYAPGTALQDVLRSVHAWLGDYDLAAVSVHLAGRTYTLEHERPRPLRDRDPDELPTDVELDV